MWPLMEFTMVWEITHISETERKKAEITNHWQNIADSEISMATAGQTTNSLLLVNSAWGTVIYYGWIILL